MAIKLTTLDRRRFLRGTGIALALPCFESFSKIASATKLPVDRKRLACFYMPDGVPMPLADGPAYQDWSWFPHGGGKEFELTKCLEPLEPLRSDLTVLSGYITAGQRCTCARRLIVVNGPETDQFLAELKKQVLGISYGFNGDTPEPFMGTVINAATGNRLMSAYAGLIDRGAVALVEMEQRRDCDALLSPGLLDITNVTDREDEELFGPLMTIIRVGSFEEAIAEANRTQYGLSAGLLSDNPELYQQFIHQIRAGIVNWNRQTTGASGKLPFGGCGLSGNHRPSAYYAVDYCSFPVASIESPELEMPEKKLTGLA